MLGVQREHRRQRLAAEAQRDVGVVLEDDEVVRRRPARSRRLRFSQRERVAGRVLEVGDDVGELRARRAPAPSRCAERVACRSRRARSSTACSCGAAFAQRQQRAVVGGALDDHLVAGSARGARTGTRRPASSRWSPARARARRRGARRSSCAGAGSRRRCRRRWCPRGRSRRRARRRRAGPRRRRCPATGRRGRRRWSGPGVAGTAA